MSAQRQDTGSEAELDLFIRTHERMLRKMRSELQYAHLAAAARRIQATAPSIAEIIIGNDVRRPGRLFLLKAVDLAGKPVTADVRRSAELVLRQWTSSDFVQVAGRTVRIADASRWWPGP